MNLIKYYDDLYTESIQHILSDTYVIDKRMDSSGDNKFGMTLLIRPPVEIKDNIQLFLKELKMTEPAQYYYSNPDIHITVLSIISCYTGFSLGNISVPEYIEIIEKSMVKIHEIQIDFQGITASDSAVMIRGFPNDDSLNHLRDSLRQNFKSSGLEESIDKRYSIFAAHSTVVRFREKIKNKKKLIEILGKYLNHDFGKFQVLHFDLVYNDWYQREKFVKQLHRFDLR